MNIKKMIVLLILGVSMGGMVSGETPPLKNTLEVSVFGRTPDYFKEEQIYLVIDKDALNLNYDFHFSYIRLFVNISDLKIIYNGTRKLVISDNRGTVLRTLTKGQYFDFFVHDQRIARISFFPGRVEVKRSDDEGYSLYMEIR